MSSPVVTPPPESEQFRLTPAVQAIIALNLLVMLAQTAVGYPDMRSWLGFDTTGFPGHWWSPVTYMFVHAGLTPLLVNAYALYLFGPRVERQWGSGGAFGNSNPDAPRTVSWGSTSRRFAGFYLLCGLGGVACQLLFFRSGTLIGASAAVFGVMTAYAMQWPDDEVMFLFVFPVRARSLMVGLLVFNVVMGVAGADGGAGAAAGTNLAYFAHLGGVFAAYVYMRMVSTSPNIDQVRQRVANLPEADEPPRAIPRNPPRRERADEVDDVVAKSKATIAKRIVAASPSPRRAEPRADELDRLLDKISEHGIDSLTSDERSALEEMSKRFRGRES
ncbi:MAG TPA: rhomboid family intramembrane serine protease [Gemmatimonadaceae bacterium]|nr:rhomboid family intramembrane serine protease [Gemmatimonadaceae bacterium]